jgi:uncharacterized membrane protein YfcA
LANGSAEYEQISKTFLLFGDPATALKVPLPRRVTGVGAQREKKGRRIFWNAVFDCNGAAVAGYNIYRAVSAAGPFSKINTELVTDTVYFDTDATVGIAGGGGGSGGAGYYMVTAVDSGGTESVQSLAVKPASAMSSAAASVIGCFIHAAGHPPVKPYLLIWLLVTIVVALGVWRSRKLRTEC